jgi:hypothetical protein
MLGNHLLWRNLLPASAAIHGFWIPAIHAGMTCFEILVYNDESSSLETNHVNHLKTTEAKP